MPFASTIVNPENGPIAPGGYVSVYLFVVPSKVICSDLILAKLLVDVEELLKPAIWIKLLAEGAELKVIVTVFAVTDCVNAVVGTPSISHIFQTMLSPN